MKDKAKNTNLNILIVGASGVGKSSTINALFDDEQINKIDLPDIGISVEPTTQKITSYKINEMVLWDTPGLGDTKEQDIEYKRMLTEILQQTKNNVAIIDFVIVILDGNTKDIGTSIDLINSVIIPNLGNEAEKRILVAINKIDTIKNSRYWDRKLNKPEEHLESYLKTLVENISLRIHESTKLNINPIIYSVGNSDINQKPYNLLQIINSILMNLPNKKRAIVIKSVNKDEKNWTDNINTKDQRKVIKDILKEILRTGLLAGLSSFFGGLIFFDY